MIKFTKVYKVILQGILQMLTKANAVKLISVYDLHSTEHFSRGWDFFSEQFRGWGLFSGTIWGEFF